MMIDRLTTRYGVGADVQPTGCQRVVPSQEGCFPDMNIPYDPRLMKRCDPRLVSLFSQLFIRAILGWLEISYPRQSPMAQASGPSAMAIPWRKPNMRQVFARRVVRLRRANGFTPAQIEISYLLALVVQTRSFIV